MSSSGSSEDESFETQSSSSEQHAGDLSSSASSSASAESSSGANKKAAAKGKAKAATQQTKKNQKKGSNNKNKKKVPSAADVKAARALDTDDKKKKKNSSSSSSSNNKGEVMLYDGGVARDEDSESEEEKMDGLRQNTVGNVPTFWYDDADHIGYDLDGKRILKSTRKDELDAFLKKMEESSEYWKTVRDEVNDRDVQLTDKELDLIYKLQKGAFGGEGTDPHADWNDFDWYEGNIHPVSAAPEPKRRFVPSKWEHKKIMKIVRAIRKGWIKVKDDVEPEAPNLAIWDDQSTSLREEHDVMYIPAPKAKLPGHAASYNPPEEYILTEEEVQAMLMHDPEDRQYDFIPKKYDSLRKVPGYGRFINERFERCLDLYLCPRTIKHRLHIDPETLIPKLPKPKELRPFPTMEAMTFKGHTDRIRALSVSPCGNWLATACDDKQIRFFEVRTGRCLRAWKVPEIPEDLHFNPNPNIHLLLAAWGHTIAVLVPPQYTASKAQRAATDDLLNQASNATGEADTLEMPEEDDDEDEDEEQAKKKANDDGDGDSDSDNAPARPREPERPAATTDWAVRTGPTSLDGIRIAITLAKKVKRVTWHYKGDYFASVAPDANTRAVAIHQLSKRGSQFPFRKLKGQVQCVKFHPTKPFFFVATQRYVRVYNLMKQELVKKLNPSAKWISSIAVHPGGDNVLVGTYDKRVAWMDLDLSSEPYKTMRYHEYAVRDVQYHPKLPLFASCSDDGTIQVFHGTVYSDLLQNALIVPVKILKGHAVQNHLGVLSIAFHPKHPWVFSAGADHTVRLYVDVHSK